jgi:hypothetical protein
MLFAKMGVSRQGVSRQVEREFDPSRKDTHWGRRELARDRRSAHVISATFLLFRRRNRTFDSALQFQN